MPAPEVVIAGSGFGEHTSGRDHELETPRLILAAGTLATLRLLLAARDIDRSLPALPRRLGQGFAPNADCLSVAYRSPLLEDWGGRGLTTVHPLGGAAVASGPDRGVIDHSGQVFGHPGLYVADSAFYPCAPGLPPSLGRLRPRGVRGASNLLDRRLGLVRKRRCRHRSRWWRWSTCQP